MVFIGHTRFSVFTPRSGAWKASNGSRFKSEDEYRAYLFSDERLAGRAEIFFNLSLPQLALAAEGYDVRHLISYSEHLPAKYENKLLEAARKYPFLVLGRQAHGLRQRTIEPLARVAMAGSSEPFGVYRLDDDDLLPANYFALNARYVKPDFVGMQVSLGSGVTAIYRDGKFYNARRCYHPMLGIGFMSIQQFDRDGTLICPPAVTHSVSDRHYPVVMDSKHLGYLWTRHIEQDTSLGLVAATEEDLLQSIRNHINQHPAVADFGELLAAFPTLDGLITAAPDDRSGHQELVSAATPVPDSGLSFDASADGEVTVTAKIVCDMHAEPRNALLSFALVDDGGRMVPREQVESHMREQEIGFSDNPSVGWYRYMNTRPGQNRTAVKFRLPVGVHLAGVRVRKWRKLDTEIKLHSLTVEHQHSADHAAVV